MPILRRWNGVTWEPTVVGAQGPAATLNVGTTTTSAPGGNASVTNSGTSSAAVFNFTIPTGAQGPQGPTGDSRGLDLYLNQFYV